jgi:dTMP kinase
MFNDIDQIDRYLEQLHPESRSLFLMHALYGSIERSRQRTVDFIITDGYWFKYYATEVAAGADPGYLDALVSLLEEPDYLFHLMAAEDLAAQRKERFSRYECGFAHEISERTFTAFQQRANEILDRVVSARRAITLDAYRSVAHNRDLVLKHIQVPPYDKSTETSRKASRQPQE